MTKTLSNLTLFLLFLLAFESCNKDEPQATLPTHYEGILFNYVNKSPVANNKVYLITWASEHLNPDKLWTIEYADTSLVLPNTPKGTVDSTITDKDGKFKFLYPPNITPMDFLNIYNPTTGNQDPNFCFSKIIFSKYPYNYLDTFRTEPPCILKIKMQKSTPASALDLTFQKIDFYISSSLFYSKHYFMGQKGKANHTLEIPYSEHLANKADIEFRFVTNGMTINRQILTISLQPSGETNLTILY